MSELHPFPVGTLQPSEELRTALSGMNPMPDARFVALVSGVLGALTRGDAGVDAAGAAAGAAEAAGARALHAVALDFAKCATAPAATRSALEVHGLSAGKGAAFADAYAAALPALRQALEETTGLRPPRLVDLTWRLDYLVAAQGTGRIGRPCYRVRLVLEDESSGGAPPVRRFVDVACSPQELESLAARVREAVRAAEALAPPAAPLAGGKGGAAGRG